MVDEGGTCPNGHGFQAARFCRLCGSELLPPEEDLSVAATPVPRDPKVGTPFVFLALIARILVTVGAIVLVGGVIASLVQLSRTDEIGQDLGGRGLLALQGLLATAIASLLLFALAEGIRLALAVERHAASAAGSLKALAATAPVDDVTE